MRCLFFVISLLSLSLHAQFGPVQIIDSSEDTGAATHIISADINNNGFSDILVSRAGAKDQITVYYNQGNAEFSKTIIDDNINDPMFLNVGDFNQNGFLDILTLTQTNGDVILYTQTANGFETPVILGTEASFGMAIEVHDFDSDGWLDFVVIHQHAIAIYKNNTDNTFTKHNILTTTSSPNILECFVMVKSDVNNNGHMDIITGETIGVVVYINDGNGNFTPETITPPGHHTINGIQLVDFNADGLDDLVFLDANSSFRLYEKTSSTPPYFSEHSVIAQIQTNTVKSIRSIDVNQDGLSDLYLAFAGKPRVLMNDQDHLFDEDIILNDQSGIFVQQVHVADLNQNGVSEYIWEGAGGTLAYHNNTTLSLPAPKDLMLNFYPNPITDVLHIESIVLKGVELSLYSTNGKLIERVSTDLPNSIDLSHLIDGSYFLKVKHKNYNGTHKILKR